MTALRGAGRRAWQAQCAMIVQPFNLVPRLDVVSNVLHGTLNRRGTLAALFPLRPEADIRRAVQILERLGIAGHATERAEALSGGQQQRVAIARALWGLSPTTFSGGEQPRVNIARGFVHPYPALLLDEPTASLDPVNRRVVLDLIGEAKAHGAASLGIFHDAEARAAVCDREVDVIGFAR